MIEHLLAPLLPDPSVHRTQKSLDACPVCYPERVRPLREAPPASWPPRPPDAPPAIWPAEGPEWRRHQQEAERVVEELRRRMPPERVAVLRDQAELLERAARRRRG